MSGLTDAVQIAAGQQDGYALTSTGAVYAWGRNYEGELGNGSSDGYDDTPVEVSFSLPSGVTIKAIAAGATTAYALASNGTVYAWGDNSSDQLGTGSTDSSATTPVQITSLSGVSAISAGYADAMALTSSGTLSMWGDNSYGELGNGTTTNESTPYPVSASGISGSITSLAASGNTSFVDTSSGWYAWGATPKGEVRSTREDDPQATPWGVEGDRPMVSSAPARSCGQATANP